MGDRALIILTDSKKTEMSPIIYSHWGGSSVPNYIEQAKQLMDTRLGDVSYGFARLIGIMHNNTSGNISLGGWNLPPKLKKALKSGDNKAILEFSHGDEGIFLVNVDDYSFIQYKGY